MRNFLAERVEVERQPDASALAYHARIGRFGSRGRYVVLEDVRTADSAHPVTDHVWLPRTEEFKPLQPGDKVKFTAFAQPYVKHGETGAHGDVRQLIMDYGFRRPQAVEKIARQENMSAYKLYLTVKRADAVTVPTTLSEAGAPKVSDPGRLDLRVLGGNTLAHLQAQTHGYIPVATLQDNSGGTTHIVYSHRRGWNDARKMLYGDPSKFTVQAHGLVAAGDGTPPGGRVVPVVYGR